MWDFLDTCWTVVGHVHQFDMRYHNSKYLTIKFEQHGTVGRKDMVVGDKKVMAFNDLLAATDMTARYPSHDDHVRGRVYDFCENL